MPAKNCAVPGCNTSRKNSNSALFVIYRVDLAKDEHERQHRSQLRCFILSMRDSTDKRDNIISQLERESATICDRHFRPEDIIAAGASGRRRLKLGAMPCLNLPKKSASFSSPPRKEPAPRKVCAKKFYYQNFARLKKDASLIQGGWVAYERKGMLYLDLEEDDHIQPKIRIVFTDDASMKSISFSGWPASVASCLDVDHRYQMLKTTLDNLQSLRLCDGIHSSCDSSVNRHAILSWNEGSMSVRDIFRAPSCNVIVSGGSPFSNCMKCLEYQRARGSWLNEDEVVHGVVSEDDKMISIDDEVYTAVMGVCEHSKLNEWQKLFFEEQKRNSTLTPQGRRFHPDVIRWAIEFYSRSPAAYEHVTASKFLCWSGQHVLWTYVADLFYKDAGSLLSESGLTQSHINLTPYTKMKVDLARGVLNWKVGNCLTKITGAEGTSKFILIFSKWFEIINCGYKCPIRKNDERLTWLQNDFVKSLMDWEEDVSKHHRGERKRIIARPTLEGLSFTSVNLVKLAEVFLEVMPRVWLKSFTQDILEACFGNLRMQAYRSRHPDASQAYYGLQHQVQRKSIKKIKGSNAGSSSTHGANNVWTTIYEEPIVKKKKV